MRTPYRPMMLQRLRQFVPAFAVLVALSSYMPVGAAAATSPQPPQHDQSHPRVMQLEAGRVATATTGQLQPFTPLALQAAVGGAGGPLREVFGFALASSLADP